MFRYIFFGLILIGKEEAWDERWVEYNHLVNWESDAGFGGRRKIIYHGGIYIWIALPRQSWTFHTMHWWAYFRVLHHRVVPTVIQDNMHHLTIPFSRPPFSFYQHKYLSQNHPIFITAITKWRDLPRYPYPQPQPRTHARVFPLSVPYFGSQISGIVPWLLNHEFWLESCMYLALLGYLYIFNLRFCWYLEFGGIGEGFGFENWIWKLDLKVGFWSDGLFILDVV